MISINRLFKLFSKWFVLVSVLISSRINFHRCDSLNIENLLMNSNEFKTLEQLLEKEMDTLYYSKDWSSTKEDLLKEEILDLDQFNRSIVELFETPRNHENPTFKLEFQQKLKDKLLYYGYENVIDQIFKIRYSEIKNDKEIQHHELGRNVLAILNGKYSDESKHIQRVLLRKIINLRRNKIDKKIFNETITDHDLAVIEENFISKQKDKLLVVGAHYDTFAKNILGIEDNASASFALLELARLLKDFKFKLNFSVLFVFFDFEELGGLGSTAFVDHYLNDILKKENRTFYGAIILDMLLNINQQHKIEQIERMKTFNPQSNDVIHEEITLNDSISIWFRKDTDASLASQLINSFNLKQNNQSQIALLPIKLDFNNEKRKLNETSILNSTNRFYLRGDHFSFWSKNYVSKICSPLPTVLLTNMAPWRNSTIDCYHKECDDLRQLTKENLIFLNKIIYLLRDAIINLDD